MRCSKVVIFVVAGAVSIAFANVSAEARRAASVKHAGAGAWTLGVVSLGPRHLYGPHYGYPSFPSYWSGPTSGAYVFDPTVCYAPRAYPSFGHWHWQLEDVC
jgi:hypothetical protein